MYTYKLREKVYWLLRFTSYAIVLNVPQWMPIEHLEFTSWWIETAWSGFTCWYSMINLKSNMVEYGNAITALNKLPMHGGFIVPYHSFHLLFDTASGSWKFDPWNGIFTHETVFLLWKFDSRNSILTWSLTLETTFLSLENLTLEMASWLLKIWLLKEYYDSWQSNSWKTILTPEIIFLFQQHFDLCLYYTE